MAKLSGMKYSKLDQNYLKKFERACFNQRPPCAKQKKKTWDVNILLNYLRKLGDNSNIPINKLGGKAALLILLSTMCRKSDLFQLNLEHLTMKGGNMTFELQNPIKTYSAKSYKMEKAQKLIIQHFPHEETLCLVKTLKDYLLRVRIIRPVHIKEVFILFREDSKKAQPRTVTRWVTTLLKEAGLDGYTIGSTRQAASSNAFRMGVNILTILKSAGWTNAKTFAKHYMREVSLEQTFLKDPNELDNGQKATQYLREISLGQTLSHSQKRVNVGQKGKNVPHPNHMTKNNSCQIAMKRKYNLRESPKDTMNKERSNTNTHTEMSTRSRPDEGKGPLNKKHMTQKKIVRSGKITRDKNLTEKKDRTRTVDKTHFSKLWHKGKNTRAKIRPEIKQVLKLKSMNNSEQNTLNSRGPEMFSTSDSHTPLLSTEQGHKQYITTEKMMDPKLVSISVGQQLHEAGHQTPDFAHTTMHQKTATPQVKERDIMIAQCLPLQQETTIPPHLPDSPLLAIPTVNCPGQKYYKEPSTLHKKTPIVYAAASREITPREMMSMTENKEKENVMTTHQITSNEEEERMVNESFQLLDLRDIDITEVNESVFDENELFGEEKDEKEDEITSEISKLIEDLTDTDLDITQFYGKETNMTGASSSKTDKKKRKSDTKCKKDCTEKTRPAKELVLQKLREKLNITSGQDLTGKRELQLNNGKITVIPVQNEQITDIKTNRVSKNRVKYTIILNNKTTEFRPELGRPTLESLKNRKQETGPSQEWFLEQEKTLEKPRAIIKFKPERLTYDEKIKKLKKANEATEAICLTQGVTQEKC